MPKEQKSSPNKRIIYALVFLVIVLPVVTGILVWKLLPECDESSDNDDGKSGAKKGNLQTTPPPDGQTTTEPFENGPWKTLRLPTDKYIPIHYELDLFPDFYEDEETFYGNVTIEVAIKQNTNVIMVHILYLNISSTALKTDKGEEIEISRTFEYTPNQFWVVETKDPMVTGSTVLLSLQFTGNLTKSIVGFYKSTYTNSNTGKKR